VYLETDIELEEFPEYDESKIPQQYWAEEASINKDLPRVPSSLEVQFCISIGNRVLESTTVWLTTQNRQLLVLLLAVMPPKSSTLPVQAFPEDGQQTMTA
jgi:hypothetical protein